MANNRIKVYSHEEFSRNTQYIIRRKKSNKQNFILGFPALPKEDIKTAKNELEIAMEAKESGLVDHVCLVFAGSKEDEMAEMAESLGVTVVCMDEIDIPDMLPSSAGEGGKGADMRRFDYWAYNHLFTGDLEKNVVASLDIDIKKDTFGMHYISGIFGPYAKYPEKSRMIKLVYARKKGWGRSNKGLLQPLLSLINHPKLLPLRSLPYAISGEAAWDGVTLLDLEFCQRYGIETYQLLQIFLDDKFNEDLFAVVNVGKMDHNHQEYDQLRWMNFGILRIFLYALDKYGVLPLNDNISLSDTLEYSEVDIDDNVLYKSKELIERIYAPLSTIIPKVKI